MAARRGQRRLVGRGAPRALTTVCRPAGRRHTCGVAVVRPRGWPASNVSGRSRPGGARCRPRRSSRNRPRADGLDGSRSCPCGEPSCAAPRPSHPAGRPRAIAHVTSIARRGPAHLAAVVVALEREPVARLHGDDLDGDLLVGDETAGTAPRGAPPRRCPEPGAVADSVVIGRVRGLLARRHGRNGGASALLVVMGSPSSVRASVPQTATLVGQSVRRGPNQPLFERPPRPRPGAARGGRRRGRRRRP